MTRMKSEDVMREKYNSRRGFRITCWHLPATIFSSTLMDNDRLILPSHVGGWEGTRRTRKDGYYDRHCPV